jgi:glycosyltransferase involved in cell wall biosynthesis
MRIALVSETYPPDVNGVALTVHGLEAGLRALGHQVRVVRPRPAEAGAPAAARADSDEPLLVDGLPLPRYPGLRFGLPAGRTLEAAWRAWRPDAVYVATEGPLGWSAVRATRRLGIPCCTGFHTRFDDYVGRYGAPFLAPLVFRWLRRFHNAADATLVPTTELSGFLQGEGFRRVELLRRAVDTALFSPVRRDPALRLQWGTEDHDLAVVHVGRLAAEKNLRLAVEAFRALQRRQPRARFIWVGDGPERAALADANPDMHFAGIQRGERLAAHVASADLFLFPSLSETFGNVTLEAMASGVPTVAFDYGAAREHLRDGVHGAAVAREDEPGFIDAALRLGGDPALRARMGLAAREAMLPLRQDAVAEQFAALLAGLGDLRSAA